MWKCKAKISRSLIDIKIAQFLTHAFHRIRRSTAKHFNWNQTEDTVGRARNKIPFNQFSLWTKVTTTTFVYCTIILKFKEYITPPSACYKHFNKHSIPSAIATGYKNQRKYDIIDEKCSLYVSCVLSVGKVDPVVWKILQLLSSDTD